MATTLTSKTTITEKIIEAYAPRIAAMAGDQSLRIKALESFRSMGIPGRRSEEYKYVNLESVLKDISFDDFSRTIISDAAAYRIIENCNLIFIVDGHFDAALSSLSFVPDGMVISDIGDTASDAAFTKHYAAYASIDSDPFIALNTALATGGVFIHLAKNIVSEIPLHIVHITTRGGIVSPRNLVVLEENAQLVLIESFVSATGLKTFDNALTEILLSPNANLNHYKIQDQKEHAAMVNTTQIRQERASVLSTNNFSLSGNFIRNNLTIVLDAENIESNLNGLYLTNGTQVVDNHTLVDHRKPNCNSNELYKGIIEGKSSATFNGKIYVRKDAQKTNAFQSNKNILLSDDGTINTKPQLEIYADDVKCSHGTSTGKLDEDKIFYLRARGLSELSAKKLLMHAFASEVVDMIKIEELRNYVEEKIATRFA
jgi:Fe-S cluster assembly protein SufD